MRKVDFQGIRNGRYILDIRCLQNLTSTRRSLTHHGMSFAGVARWNMRRCIPDAQAFIIGLIITASARESLVDLARHLGAGLRIRSGTKMCHSIHIPGDPMVAIPIFVCVRFCGYLKLF